MANDVSSDDVPSTFMMSLPDEVLCHIFSFVTHISTKIQLESVCKRFQRISTTQTNSWKGSDKIQLVCVCPRYHDGVGSWEDVPDDKLKFLTDCTSYDYERSYLNGQKLSVNKWLKAIEQLLKKTVVHKLCIDINAMCKDDLPFLRQVFDLLQNSSRIRLSYIEFHRENRGSNPGRNLADDLYLWAVASSVKTAQSIVLSLENIHIPAEKWMQLCTGLEACRNLSLFSIKLPTIQTQRLSHQHLNVMQLIHALQGKPLRSVTIGSQFLHPDPNVEAGVDGLTPYLVPICKNAGGSGITSLKVYFPDDPLYSLVDFAKTLHPPTAQSLVELWIANGSINEFVPDLNHLPARFPNLRELHLVNLNDPDLDDEALLFNTKFFSVCDETPLVSRKVFICFLVVDEQVLRAGIAGLCDEQGVQAFYAEREEQSWLTLKKGWSIIEIRQIEDIAELVSDSSDSDSDDEADDDEIDFDHYVNNHYEEEGDDGDYEYEGDEDDDSDQDD